MQYFELNGFPAQPLTRSRWIWRAGIRECFLLLGLLAVGFLAEQLNADEPPQTVKTHRVALFTGSTEHNPFWVLFADFMREAGDDLGIELEVFLAEGSRNKMASQIREVCQRKDKPDAIVVQSFKKNGLNSLRIADRYRVPVFLVNAGLNEEQKEIVGEPRTKLKFWIGEMLPNDYDAGFQLANALIDEALKDPRRLAKDGRVHLIGLNGVVSDGASIQRVAGLHDAVASRPDEAALDQVVAADWERSLAHFRCRILHRRYPEASVIWSASDWMAVGAIDAMGDHRLTPGQDVIIGGVDASPEAMKLIEQGTLHATIGGHFMDGGWVAVLLYDYFRGFDLEQIRTHFASPMTLITKDKLADYQSGLNPATWKGTDFRQFSRIEHPELKSYQFGPSKLATGKNGLAKSPAHANQGNASKTDDEDQDTNSYDDRNTK